jgi:short-subunit dehydrogenase
MAVRHETQPGSGHEPNPQKLTALVTGASSGIGMELARLFARDGYNLVLAARDRDKLENLAAELRTAHGVQALVVVCDLADRAAPAAVAAEIQGRGIEIDFLVNNAGTQVYGEFTSTSLEQQLALVEVNNIAVVQLTHLFLPGMLARGRGWILNLGSTGSFVPGPLNAVYCASKAFILSFSLAVGAELAGSGISVTCLCPGATNTAFMHRHNMENVRLFRNPMPPVEVAKKGYRAMLRGRSVVVAGFGNRVQVLLYQLMAPFMGLTPPSFLKSAGSYIMGRSS